MNERDWLLHRRLIELAEDRPDAIIEREVDGVTETRRELLDAIQRWAGAYRHHGIGEGDVVATMLPTGITSTHAWLGAGWARAIESPANTMYHGEMLTYFLNDCGAKLLVIHDQFLDRLAQVQDDVVELGTVVVVGNRDRPWPALRFATLSLAEFLGEAEPLRAIDPPRGHDIACMIYTSGTTGPSKGVLMPWRELCDFATGMPPEAFVNKDAGYYSVTPMFHVSGRTAIIHAVANGVHSIIREKFSVSNFWPDIARYRCESTFVLGAMASMLIKQPREGDPAENSLRVVCMGPVIPQVDEFRERFGVDVVTSYGMTEIGLPLYASAEGLPAGSCGKPQEGFELRVVADHDVALGPGQVGELVVRTDEPWKLNAGYWRKPEATARVWTNGWFHTGDAFRYDEQGYFYFVDRIKDALRRRGENISSFEVENLVRRHPDVADAAAIAVPSHLTEDDLKVVAVREDGCELTAEALFEFLKQTMPQFMLPRYIEFVADLPRTHTNRVKKAQLRSDPFTPATWDGERGRFIGELSAPAVSAGGPA